MNMKNLITVLPLLAAQLFFMMPVPLHAATPDDPASGKVREVDWSISMYGFGATEASLPFWAETNRHGIFPDVHGGLVTAGVSLDYSLPHSWYIDSKVSLAGSAVPGRFSGMADEIYVGVGWKKLRLDLGMKDRFQSGIGPKHEKQGTKSGERSPQPSFPSGKHRHDGNQKNQDIQAIMTHQRHETQTARKRGHVLFRRKECFPLLCHLHQKQDAPVGMGFVPLSVLCPKVGGYANKEVYNGTDNRYKGWVRPSFYGINTNVYDSSAEWRCHVLNKVKTPSSKLLQVETNDPTAAENKNYGSWGIYRAQADISSSNRVAYAHNSRANVLYFDLHIQAQNYPVLYNQYNTGKNWEPYR